MVLRIALAVLVSSVLALADDVRLYTSVDQPIARKVVRDFEKATGIRVIMTTDAEGTKTTGIVERLRAEKSNPQADVWWNNEISHTIRLADEDVLQPYASPMAKDIPPMFVDPQNRWTGIGFRVRVLIVNAKDAGMARGYRDLTKPELKGKIAIAKPGFGTAGGHFAALYAALGEEKYLAFLRELKANEIKVLGGNSIVADYVGRGQLLAGFTDNDDVQSAIDQGAKAEMVLPDQEEGGIGTMVVPCTVSLIKGGKNEVAGKKLVDFLLRRETEQMLLDEKYMYASVRDGAKVRTVKASFAEIAKAMPTALKLASRELEQ